MPNPHPHRMGFTVPGDNISRAISILESLDRAESDVSEVRIELSSESEVLTSDFLTTLSDSVINSNSESGPDLRTSDTLVEDKTTRESAPPDGTQESDEDGHLTSKLLGDSEEDSELSEDEYEEQRHMDLTDIEEDDPPTLDELPDFKSSMEYDQIGFHIAGLLYCVDERLKLKSISDSLEGTPWEENYKSISAQLSLMRDDGLVDKNKEHAGEYQLTDLGEKYIHAMMHERDDYPLTIGYKIAGLHPNSGDLKAEPQAN